MNVSFQRYLNAFFRILKVSQNPRKIHSRPKGLSKTQKIGFINKSLWNSTQNKRKLGNVNSTISNFCSIEDKDKINQFGNDLKNTQFIFLRNSCTTQNESLLPSGFHKECEHAVNEQILAELNAAYAYLSMACYFGRAEVALPGCYGFFIKMHEEEMGHAHKFIRYQNMRGGHVRLCPLTCTDCTEWNIKKAFEVALEMEKLIKEKLICVNNIAEKNKDLNLMDMVVTDFIAEQERSINEFSRLVTRYKDMCGCGCANYLFDKHIYSSFVKKVDNVDIYELEEKYK